MGLHKVLKIVAFALAIIGAIFALMIMAGDEEAAQSMGGNMLYVSYVVLFIIVALVLIFVIKGLFAGNVKKTLMSVGAFLAIIVLSYAMSSGTDLDLQPFVDKGADVTEATSKRVGAGLYAFYVLAILAIASMAYSGVKKIFNK
ncbi:hypothetical protein [Seonamhaeicola aphaedonensis]|uniref:Uncharacterized protein n=1 Tax=Seonamhaeicola aphaedonensis TaxID=1461338 RepID=A0A3D9HM19_9FLAO|nr:hypothetical protein [Seonamhaeicola aphaedonensis]RED50529.1 hypothetical protein DFQ02_101562 [Seonamhaeicola aphaedonensis]